MTQINFSIEEIDILLEMCQRVLTSEGPYRAEDLRAIKESPHWVTALQKIEAARDTLPAVPA